MHNPHNQELQNAFASLVSSKTVKNQAQVAKALNVKRPTLSNILSGKEKASPEFCKRFEDKYLKPLGQTLKEWKKPLVIIPQAAVFATHEEFASSTLLKLEFMLEEVMKQNCQILSEQFRLNNPKKKVITAAEIETRVREIIQAKVEAVQGAQGGTKVS